MFFCGTRNKTRRFVSQWGKKNSIEFYGQFIKHSSKYTSSKVKGLLCSQRLLRFFFFYFNIFKKVIYSFDIRAEFSASLLQSSVSHDPSEIILIWWFGAQETVHLIIKFQNSCALKATLSKIFYLKIMLPKPFQWFIKS